MKQLLILVALIFSLSASSQDLLESEKWKSFFTERPYLEKAKKINDETFWEVDDIYTYYTGYPVLLIYADGGTREIKWSYSGLGSLINKKEALEDIDFERYEKENVIYIVFDGYLFKNPEVENAIEGDFMLVYEQGPLSVYREYITNPITRDNMESIFAIYKEGQKDDTFYLGKFEKKAAKLVDDYPRLAKKIKDKIIGYRNEEDDIVRIAQEYNELVKENNPYRYDDYYLFFWQRWY
ncbi:hypothetical protein SAMN05421640_3779 [Ekhidna lutea]|uniref:Uncharacterized protein n=1 Tax=Ekhidna lutea TaxID=447679 RepID=A0A239MAF5_EKHLU|nr:hypothetical protein [Ekhidna lutea]SNT39957.1 hypothetical protein SAMN05421640_3779 [Ekhidna lutea]